MPSTSEKIIALLKKAQESKDDKHLSGQFISDKLSISRSAVWKHIKNLEAAGFQFETLRGKGYRLRAEAEPFNGDTITEHLKKFKLRNAIEFFNSLDSTNTKAYDLAKKDCPDQTVVIADHQKKGKGRVGRHWYSPKGKNLYLSIVLRPGISPMEAQNITLAMGVALADTIKVVTPAVSPTLKWPNDVLVDGKKIAGILTEMNSESDRINFIIIGIGVNLNSHIKTDSKEVKAIAASLKELTGEPINRSLFTATLIKNLDNIYKDFLNGNNDAILKRWSEYFDLVGKTITVKGPPSVKGTCMGIDENGALLVRTSPNTTEKITFGDLVT